MTYADTEYCRLLQKTDCHGDPGREESEGRARALAGPAVGIR